MVIETLTSLASSNGVPLAAGAILGFAVGYALKKIVKFVIIGLGLIATPDRISGISEMDFG